MQIFARKRKIPIHSRLRIHTSEVIEFHCNVYIKSKQFWQVKTLVIASIVFFWGDNKAQQNL